MLDEVHLLEIAGGDAEFVSQIKEEFLKSAPSLLAEIDAAIARNERQSVLTAAHTLKGSCRTIGAIELAKACEGLELQARAGDELQYGTTRDRIEQAWITLHTQMSPSA